MVFPELIDSKMKAKFPYTINLIALNMNNHWAVSDKLVLSTMWWLLKIILILIMLKKWYINKNTLEFLWIKDLWGKMPASKYCETPTFSLSLPLQFHPNPHPPLRAHLRAKYVAEPALSVNTDKLTESYVPFHPLNYQEGRVGWGRIVSNPFYRDWIHVLTHKMQ